MRARTAWLAGAAGAAIAVYRRMRRPAPAAPAPVEDPRAEELRQKLDESRAVVGEREEFEAGETPVDQADPEAPVDDRRQAVHERGKAAAEQMRRKPGE